MWSSEYGRKNKEILDSLKEMFIFIISDKGIHFYYFIWQPSAIFKLTRTVWAIVSMFLHCLVNREHWLRGTGHEGDSYYVNRATHVKIILQGRGTLSTMFTRQSISPHGLHANTSALPQGKYLTTWNYSKKRFIKRKNHANKTHLYTHKNLAHLKEVPVLYMLSILPMWQCC